MSDPKEPSDLNDNVSADWEGADEIEQDLQDKIRSNMENQEPKIENKKSIELPDSEWDIVLTGLSALVSESYLGSDPSKEELKELLQKIEKMLGK